MRKKSSMILAALFTLMLVVPSLAASETITLTSNKRGTYDGFDYELWSQRNTDPVSMTLTGGGTFECSWNAENILFRTGKKLGSKKTYEEYGKVTVDYGAEHTITKGNTSYLTIYGWTENPMIEFYIVENYGSYKPPGGVGYKGDIEVDGGIYEVYVNTRIEMPSIQGKKTFEQYYSVRKDKRTSGTITVSDHFKAWEELGLDMSGKMYEVSFCVEGFNSSGSANVYKHVLTVGDTTYGSEPEPYDSASKWAREGISSAIEKGFVPTDLQDRYQSIITRQEFCRMAVQFVEYKTGKDIDSVLADRGVSRDSNAFSDTSDPSILAAYALGITSGTKAPTATSPGVFTPNGEFDREQAATMIRNVCKVIGMDVSEPSDQGFTDIGTASTWAVNGINYVCANGIMSGTSASTRVFNPKGTYTRQESIVTFNNFK